MSQKILTQNIGCINKDGNFNDDYYMLYADIEKGKNSRISLGFCSTLGCMDVVSDEGFIQCELTPEQALELGEFLIEISKEFEQ